MHEREGAPKCGLGGTRKCRNAFARSPREEWRLLDRKCMSGTERQRGLAALWGREARENVGMPFFNKIWPEAPRDRSYGRCRATTKCVSPCHRQHRSLMPRDGRPRENGISKPARNETRCARPLTAVARTTWDRRWSVLASCCSG